MTYEEIKQETMVLLTKGGAVIGRCVHYPHQDGWCFLPATAAHKPSRKAWPSANACIPKWAFNMSDDLLTASEWAARQSR